MRSRCPHKQVAGPSPSLPATCGSTSGSATRLLSTATKATPPPSASNSPPLLRADGGFYVGATRGREQNLILVVTETADLDDARDLLEHVLASDRVDIPATTQRRTLATTGRPPARPIGRRAPRCAIPVWLDDLEAHFGGELQHALTESDSSIRLTTDLERRLTEAEHQLRDAVTELQHHQPAITAASDLVEAAGDARRLAERRLTQAPRRQRRAHRLDLDEANQAYERAVTDRRTVEAVIAPARARYRDGSARVDDVRVSLTPARFLHEWSDHHRQVDELTHLADAVGQWRAWAIGGTVTSDMVQVMVAALEHGASRHHQGGLRVLAATVREWAADAGIQVPDAPEVGVPTRPDELGLGR